MRIQWPEPEKSLVNRGFNLISCDSPGSMNSASPVAAQPGFPGGAACASTVLRHHPPAGEFGMFALPSRSVFEIG